MQIEAGKDVSNQKVAYTFSDHHVDELSEAGLIRTPVT